MAPAQAATGVLRWIYGSEPESPAAVEPALFVFETGPAAYLLLTAFGKVLDDVRSIPPNWGGAATRPGTIDRPAAASPEGIET